MSQSDLRYSSTLDHIDSTVASGSEMMAHSLYAILITEGAVAMRCRLDQ